MQAPRDQLLHAIREALDPTRDPDALEGSIRPHQFYDDFKAGLILPRGDVEENLALVAEAFPDLYDPDDLRGYLSVLASPAGKLRFGELPTAPDGYDPRYDIAISALAALNPNVTHSMISGFLEALEQSGIRTDRVIAKGYLRHNVAADVYAFDKLSYDLFRVFEVLLPELLGDDLVAHFRPLLVRMLRKNDSLVQVASAFRALLLESMVLSASDKVRERAAYLRDYQRYHAIRDIPRPIDPETATEPQENLKTMLGFLITEAKEQDCHHCGPLPEAEERIERFVTSDLFSAIFGVLIEDSSYLEAYVETLAIAQRVSDREGLGDIEHPFKRLV